MLPEIFHTHFQESIFVFAVWHETSPFFISVSSSHVLYKLSRNVLFSPYSYPYNITIYYKIILKVYKISKKKQVFIACSKCSKACFCNFFMEFTSVIFYRIRLLLCSGICSSTICGCCSICSSTVCGSTICISGSLCCNCAWLCYGLGICTLRSAATGASASSWVTTSPLRTFSIRLLALSTVL